MIQYTQTPDYYRDCLMHYDFNDPDFLEHYGVTGMRWGVRRDLRKYGTISGKTKKKINKALSKASYGKHRRMLNTLEGMKADYGAEAAYRKDKDKRKGTTKTKLAVAKANSDVSKLKGLTNMAKASANKKGYKYTSGSYKMMTSRASNNVNAFGVAGLIGNSIAQKKYKQRNGEGDSPYMTTAKVYKKIKKKKS